MAWPDLDHSSLDRSDCADARAEFTDAGVTSGNGPTSPHSGPTGGISPAGSAEGQPNPHGQGRGAGDARDAVESAGGDGTRETASHAPAGHAAADSGTILRDGDADAAGAPADGVEFEYGTERYRYAGTRTYRTGTTIRLTQRFNGEKWVLASDPFKASKPDSIARQTRRERAANFEDPLPHANNVKPRTARAGAPLDPEDQVRLTLRQHAKQVRSGCNTDLISLPGYGVLSFAIRYIDGGRDAFIQFIQMCVVENQPNASAWYEIFRRLTPYERKFANYDDVAAAAGVQPSKLMGEVISVVMESGRDAGNLVAAMTHPKVVAAAVQSAQRIDGEHAEIALKDRHALLQGAGLIPTPRGTTVHVSASANAKAAAAAANEPTMPGFSAALSSARQVHQNALQAAPADADLGFLNAERAVEPQEAVLVGQEEDEE